MTEFQQTVINLVHDGKTVSEIAKLLNRNMSSVSSVVKRFNLKPQKKYTNTIVHNFFDSIDNEYKSYLLGFFIADGSIYSDKKSNGRFSINNSEDDKEIIKAFKKYLKIPSDIHIVNCKLGCKHRKLQWRIRWTSSYMKNIFEKEYNIHQNKTIDINFQFPFELIPENLQNHFIRGFIDGDGYIGNNGCKNNFSISIVGTSEIFLKQIGDLISSYTGMSYKLYKYTGKTVDYISLRWSCERKNKFEKITKLREYLYKDATLFLRRKKKKIDTYIKYRANVLNNINTQCNAQEVNLETEYNLPKSAQPITDNADGENIC